MEPPTLYKAGNFEFWNVCLCVFLLLICTMFISILSALCFIGGTWSY